MTEIVIGSVLVFLLGYETYTLINTKQADTISEAIWRACKARPYILFFAGLLCGHLFWCPCELK